MNKHRQSTAAGFMYSSFHIPILDEQLCKLLIYADNMRPVVDVSFPEIWVHFVKVPTELEKKEQLRY